MFFICPSLIWREGISIIAFLVIMAIIGIRWFMPLAWCACICFLFSYYFFRCPARECTSASHNPSVLVCPADGLVVDISYDTSCIPAPYVQKISIVLSLFDAHVTWSPLTGTIKDIMYKPGKHLIAYLPKSSLDNEHNDVVFIDEKGRTVCVRQIAGMIARRIACFVLPNQTIKKSDIFGMIKFGSRVDFFLPANVCLSVGVGQRVQGGFTEFGRWQ